LLPAHTTLSERPSWVPSWTDLGAGERAVYARYMEAFAGYLTHADAQIGRLVEWLRRHGELDNTIVMVLSDNGASSEGGPTGSLNDGRLWNGFPRTVDEAVTRIDEIGGPRIHNNYPWGWTVAGNTPFRRWKRETHEGGVCDPLVVHWPDGIDAGARGGVRRQFVHAVDLAPTVLELAGVAFPSAVGGVTQQPFDGTSFAYTFDPAAADAGAVPERHTRQYFEMFGCRALYDDGWKAVTYHDIQSDEPGLDQAAWELYDLRADPSETNDLAAVHPERLAAMIQQWWAEAEANHVLPVDNRPWSDLVFNRPPSTPPRDRYVYWPGRAPVPENSAVNVRRPHTITAFVEIGDVPAQGVIAAQGSVLGGWSLHVRDDGYLCYVHNHSGWRESRVEALVRDRLTPGAHTIAFRYGAPAATLLVDGAVVAEGEIPRFTPTRFSLTGAGLTVGWSPDFSPADRDYRGAFRFTGTIDRVEIDVVGEPAVDLEGEARDAIAAQ
jgi:arylsulfatase